MKGAFSRILRLHADVRAAPQKPSPITSPQANACCCFAIAQPVPRQLPPVPRASVSASLEVLKQTGPPVKKASGCSQEGRSQPSNRRELVAGSQAILGAIERLMFRVRRATKLDRRQR
jgi:hypothetical protein